MRPTLPLTFPLVLIIPYAASLAFRPIVGRCGRDSITTHFPGSMTQLKPDSRRISALQSNCSVVHACIPCRIHEGVIEMLCIPPND
ncbi:hypothetical protein P152DRAFT_310510 [Eremomyces bilateralis CBS 781.70]|uniref:Secreted protein n=1 Tax=Eremomyces bilateralis CBS 781.70 TaxID=1392243 RepID=A0A6G1G5D4_9PEZI|nr:uncharacterized protein P152DRAFT_310510 [Eremomyces bilateralis CBS 781.70]KAF1813228.1 hypothetical protein P152DRAFT_310510 [Eremomyces bilateralis CBS 781.70]